MKMLSVFRCLCDETRLRILNLLLDGPLCVCHLAAVLDMEQPKISRHLKALKDSGVVETERCYNWTICRVADKPGPVLEANLKCLSDLRSEEPVFHADLRRRTEIFTKISDDDCADLPAQIRGLYQSICAK